MFKYLLVILSTISAKPILYSSKDSQLREVVGKDPEFNNRPIIGVLTQPLTKS